jgi:hypothetical protein
MTPGVGGLRGTHRLQSDFKIGCHDSQFTAFRTDEYIREDWNVFLRSTTPE